MKPWHKNLLPNLLAGIAPPPSKRVFWNHFGKPIRENLIAAFVARFYDL